jgi:hypothetical protein
MAIMKEQKNILLPLGITARKLHVTTKWLKGEADANRIPHLKAGDRYLFEFSTVNALLVERASKGGCHEQN